ncbi:MAG TPA: PPE domain-containing protein [Mycobacterium sp.]|nr:PPE domain-containing protein [Mycobacterium sp.]
MDFGLYPPEINSGRMYAGPGSGPLLAAAQAWAALADELYTAAGQYESTISGLTAGAWSGPSADSMAAAAASHIEWLSTTAAQAGDTAAQAQAAAAAYETAFASTVPPEVVAANRTLLMTLIATNFFGQNTPAIAATEAQYAEMWAQDAVAMSVYAGSSAAATALTPFVSPHQNTDAAASARQAAAVSQASGTSAGNVQSTVTGAPQALAAAAAPAQATDPLDTLSNLITVFLSAPTDLVTLFGIIPADALSGPVDLPVAFLGTVSGTNVDDIVSGWAGQKGWPDTGPAPVRPFPATITNSGQSAVSAASASVGEADAIGGLSVPQAWTLAAPEIRNAAYSLPAASETAAAAGAVEASSGSVFSQLGLAGMLGPGMAGPPSGGTDGDRTKLGQRPSVRPPGASSDNQVEAVPAPRAVVTGVAARIREIAKLRDQGRLTEEEFIEQKNRLLGR